MFKMIFSSSSVSFPAPMPFKLYLSDFQSFFAESENLNEKFVQNSCIILFQLNRLFVDLQENTSQIELFINENGIYYLLQFMKILEQLFHYPICATKSQLIQENDSGKKLSNKQLKQTEQRLLSCLDFLIEQSNNAVIFVTQNADNLWTISLFLTSSNIQCQIFVLKIFTKISSAGENCTAKILGIFTTMSLALKENYRFKFLIDMINLNNMSCSPDGRIELAVLGLLIEITNNVKLANKNKVQTELEDAGFSVETFEMKLVNANVSRSDIIWNKIKQLKFNMTNLPNNSLPSDSCCTANHNGMSNEFTGQVNELNLAFKKLEHEKRILILIENDLKEKYDILMKNIHRMKIEKSINTELCSDDSNNSKIAETEKRSLYDFNMKSSEEEIVRHSVFYAANEFIFNNSCSQNAASNCNSTVSNVKINNNLKKKKLIIGTHNNNCPSVDLGVNYVDNFKTNKYFSYIMSNVNNLDVTFTPRSRSIRKSISQIFGRSHPKENKLIKNNCATTTSGLNGSIDSLIIVNNVNGCKQLPSLSGSTIALPQINPYESNIEEITNVDFGEESIKSLSLPNAFRSNFILRKNSDIYLPQLDTSNEFDSI